MYLITAHKIRIFSDATMELHSPELSSRESTCNFLLFVSPKNASHKRRCITFCCITLEATYLPSQRNCRNLISDLRCRKIYEVSTSAVAGSVVILLCGDETKATRKSPAFYIHRRKYASVDTIFLLQKIKYDQPIPGNVSHLETKWNTFSADHVNLWTYPYIINISLYYLTFNSDFFLISNLCNLSVHKNFKFVLIAESKF